MGYRIDPARIKSDLDGSCFELEAEADFLRNTSDDYSLPMYDPKVRGKTDRVVYRYRRK
jgi:predicted methyltransferase